MTQQYIAGELSLLLAQLHADATTQALASEVARLRHDAETTPPGAPAGVVVGALELADRLCWDALARGSIGEFAQQAAVGADLRQFGVCSGLIAEIPPGTPTGPDHASAGGRRT